MTAPTSPRASSHITGRRGTSCTALDAGRDQITSSLARPPNARSRPVNSTQVATLSGQAIGPLWAVSVGIGPCVPTAKAYSPSVRSPSLPTSCHETTYTPSPNFGSDTSITRLPRSRWIGPVAIGVPVWVFTSTRSPPATGSLN